MWKWINSFENDEIEIDTSERIHWNELNWKEIKSMIGATESETNINLNRKKITS